MYKSHILRFLHDNTHESPIRVQIDHKNLFLTPEIGALAQTYQNEGLTHTHWIGIAIEGKNNS